MRRPGFRDCVKGAQKGRQDTHHQWRVCGVRDESLLAGGPGRKCLEAQKGSLEGGATRRIFPTAIAGITALARYPDHGRNGLGQHRHDANQPGRSRLFGDRRTVPDRQRLGLPAIPSSTPPRSAGTDTVSNCGHLAWCLCSVFRTPRRQAARQPGSARLSLCSTEAPTLCSRPAAMARSRPSGAPRAVPASLLPLGAASPWA